MDETRAVQQTNSDAAVSKLSCSLAGYFEDEFLPFFVKRRVRRDPIINKGYYIRVMAMRRAIHRFIDAFGAGGPCQIVSLGAGSDTNALLALVRDHVVVFEVDYSDGVLSKMRTIQNHADKFNTVIPDIHDAVIGDAIGPNAHGEPGWCTKRYKLISHDLRESTDALDRKLADVGFDKTLPTLFLSECVLIYLDRDASDSVIRWIATVATAPSTPTILTLYEQVNPNDAFGRMMISNLSERGCHLASITPSCEDQKARMTDLGFPLVRIELMNHFSDLVLRKNVEIIDELEELTLLQDHYLFSLACTTTDDISRLYLASVFDTDDNAAIDQIDT